MVTSQALVHRFKCLFFWGKTFNKKMTKTKKPPWFLLYLAAFIPLGFSLNYFSGKNLSLALITFFLALSVFTFLVFKELKFLSLVSFLTLFLGSLLTLGLVEDKTDGAFSSVFDEKTSMLTMYLAAFFVLVNAAFLVKTKRGLKKLIPLVFIALSMLMLFAYGGIPPDYYQNFIYTRVNILILFAFGIFLLIKKKKAWGGFGYIALGRNIDFKLDHVCSKGLFSRGSGARNSCCLF
jgi:hypothetical protein